MLKKAYYQNTKVNRLIRLLLVFALLFATAHVATHGLDMDGGGLDGHGECEICLLNHMPAASLPVPSLLAPLQLFAYVLPLSDLTSRQSQPFHTRWARAPPLS